MNKKFNRQEVFSAIVQKIPNPKCPMCGGNRFDVIDGFFKHDVSDLPNETQFKNYVASIATCCTNCGYMSFHAAVALGILE
jgi:C4-type Zn-finger protein